MIELEDGDTLEKGGNVDPLTGAVTSYEELWTDLPVQGPLEALGEQKRVCVVLKLEDPKLGAKGMMVRIGNRIQGFVRVGDKADAGIWIYGEGQWTRTESFAEDSPLSVASSLFQLGEISEGQDLWDAPGDSKYKWKALERFFW